MNAIIVLAIPIPEIRIAVREMRLRKLLKLSNVLWRKFDVFSGKRNLVSGISMRISFKEFLAFFTSRSSLNFTLYSYSRKFSDDFISSKFNPSWLIRARSPNIPAPPISGMSCMTELTINWWLRR